MIKVVKPFPPCGGPGYRAFIESHPHVVGTGDTEADAVYCLVRMLGLWGGYVEDEDFDLVQIEEYHKKMTLRFLTLEEVEKA